MTKCNGRNGREPESELSGGKRPPELSGGKRPPLDDAERGGEEGEINYSAVYCVNLNLEFDLKQAPPGGPSRKGMDGEAAEGEVNSGFFRLHDKLFFFSKKFRKN